MTVHMQKYTKQKQMQKTNIRHEKDTNGYTFFDLEHGMLVCSGEVKGESVHILGKY